MKKLTIIKPLILIILLLVCCFFTSCKKKELTIVDLSKFFGHFFIESHS